ncbi:MAG: hypothetical protein GWN86_16850 [Desulfobacterales bacterium]|nr:hypothetical protein [Desulfobacterales bacterium]
MLEETPGGLLMPLPSISAPEEERSYILTYDPDNPKDLIEVEKNTLALLEMGFLITSRSFGEVRLKPPPLPKGVGIMRIISQNGDDRITWDTRIPEEVKDAGKKFFELIKQGYKACVTKSDGSKGHEIEEFDPAIGEIIMVPGTAPG